EARVGPRESQRPRREDITDCASRLTRLRTPVLGTVVLRPTGGGLRRARPEAPVRVPYGGPVSRPEPEPDPLFASGMPGTRPTLWTPGAPTGSGDGRDYPP